MAGHSKWANIRFRKAAQDARRGRIFTKLIREIVTAARLGGPDESSNPRLRSAVIAALAQNMTRDTIRRAVERGAGNAEGDNLESVVYEGYGAGGVAVLVECLTDNRNRTASDVRHAFAKFGGNIGAPGSVAYLFSKRGLLSFTPEAGRSVPSEEQAMEIALEAGADDVVVNDDGSVDIFTPPESFAQVADAFEQAGLRPAHAQLTQLASSEAALDAETAARFQRMLDALEELDDVQEVYHNAALPELPA